MGPCTTSLLTGQYEMIVTELAELLSEWWFPLSTNPGRADQSKVGLHCAGWYRGGECPRTGGLGHTNTNSAVARVASFILSCKYLEGFLNRDWTLLCGAGVVYEPQLAKACTPCGVVSTRENSVFFTGLLELMEYGKIYGTSVEPCLHRVRRNASRPFAGQSPLRV